MRNLIKSTLASALFLLASSVYAQDEPEVPDTSSNANSSESPADAIVQRYRGAMRATLTATRLHILRRGPKTGGEQETPAGASPMV